jgi:aerobic carbon-monoxide dehydrogenase small subunit
MKIRFTINKKSTELDVEPKKRLLDILRDDLHFVATKEGCGKGECGACTVLLNGERVNSCLVPALQLEGSKVITVEGLRDWRVFKPIEKAFIENGAVQCGFCFPGFIISTVSFLKENHSPVTQEKIKYSFGGNICRCTGYTKIIQAIQGLADHKEIIDQIQKDWKNAFGSK